MLSLDTAFNFVSDILASWSSATTLAVTKLASTCSTSIDQLNFNYAPLIFYSLLLSFACYFAFNSLVVMNDLIKTTSSNSDLKIYEDDEIELSSIDAVAQAKLESVPSGVEDNDTVNSDSDKTTGNEAEIPTALIVYQSQKVTQSSRRNSMKLRSKGPNDVGYVNLIFALTGPDSNTVVPHNHERITGVNEKEGRNLDIIKNKTDPDIIRNKTDPDIIRNKIGTDVIDNNTDPDIMENNTNHKKPWDYYLRWDLPMNELVHLSYSEKSRRFYHLTKYGEAKQPEIAQIEVDPLPPEPAKPMNLITDLVRQASQINISNLQVDLLKLNHQLAQSHLKRTEAKKFDFRPANILSGRFDFLVRYKLTRSALNLDSGST